MQYVLIAIVVIVLCVFGASCRKSPFRGTGAMCYAIALPLERTDYICPTCGGKTLYAFDDMLKDPNVIQQSTEVIIIAHELDSCRRLAQQINTLDIELDESQFCKVCSPDVEYPQLGLIVKHPDNPQPHRVWGVREYDLTLIKEYNDGQLRTEEMSDASLQRLEELLGVKLDDADER